MPPSRRAAPRPPLGPPPRPWLAPPLPAALVAALACAGCQAEPPAPDLDPTFLALQGWTAARMDEWHVPGVALAVVEHGELRHVAGLGVREVGHDAPVTPDTLFRLGSISKLFDGALVAQAAADGLLDLDAPASAALADLTLADPAALDSLTLLQLASHASGLQTNGLPNACDTDPTHGGEALAELTPEWALWTPPNELYNYSNLGFALLGHAVERSRGTPYAELAQELFDAAGMETATYDWEQAAAGEASSGHTVNGVTGEVVSVRTLDERACVASFPSGGLIASARDLGHAMEVLLADGEGWMTPDAWEIQNTMGWGVDEDSGYGFGLMHTSYAGFASTTHHGSLGGWFAMFWLVPSEGLGVGVLVNSDHYVTDPPTPWSKPTQRIIRHALDLYLGTHEEFALTSSVRPVDEWDRFVGRFHSDYDLGDVEVTREGDTLWYARPADELLVPLMPYGSNSFQYAVPRSDGRTTYNGVSFAQGSADALVWLITSDGIARREEP